MDPITLQCCKKQRFLPFLTEFTDISLPCDENVLDGLETIADVGEKVTRSISTALMVPKYRATVQERLREIKAPFDNPTKRDNQNWARSVRKTFADILSKPPTNCGLIDSSKWIRNEPELIILVDE